MLYGEPPTLWDSFKICTFRAGKELRISTQAPLPRRPRTYPNPVLEADRVEAMIRRMPGAPMAAVAKELGMTKRQVGIRRRFAALPEEIKRHVRNLGLQIFPSQITGRALERISKLSGKAEKLEAFHSLLEGRGLHGQSSSG